MGQDHESVPDAETVYRRLSDDSPDMVVVDAVSGDRRPSSGAFKPDEDGVSVYRKSLLEDRQLTPADLAPRPGNLVVSINVGEVRSLSLDVEDDPWPQGIPEHDHPRNAAHALIVGWDGLSTSARKQRQRALSSLPSLEFAFPAQK